MKDQENIQAFNGSVLEPVRRVYFIGIGGIGMSAIARYFLSSEKAVSGFDRVRTPLTIEMEKEGIQIHYEENADAVDKLADLIVYTPAIPSDNKELVYYKTNGYTVIKRSDVLKIITESSFNICIAGTHGKTTITTLIAHILRDSGYGCNAFLGGISANYNTNFWSSERNVCVIEADEYDRSFLKLTPDVAVITSMDADHLDIYLTTEAVENAFIEFSQNIKEDGCLISRYGLKRSDALTAAHHFTYSVSETTADVFAEDLKIENGRYKYNVTGNNWQLKNIVLHMGGLHNIENSVAAITAAKYLAIEDEKILSALNSFKGVKRRFEYIIKTDKYILIDDYAHHPMELQALINGVKSLFGSAKISIIFQPHLYTRTRDLADEFAESLNLADQVFLLPLYPARELPIEGINSEMIAERMQKNKAVVYSKNDLLKVLQQKVFTYKNDLQLIVMCGAGDIDTMVQPVKELLEKNSHY